MCVSFRGKKINSFTRILAISLCVHVFMLHINLLASCCKISLAYTALEIVEQMDAISSSTSECDLVGLKDAFHLYGITKYLDGDDVIHLLQCGSKQMNRTLKRESVALRFTTWHTRFLNALRLFQFLAEYFPHLAALEMNFLNTQPLSLDHKVNDDDDDVTTSSTLFGLPPFPNLSSLIIRERGDKLSALYMARFFKSAKCSTSVLFPALRTLNVVCSPQSLIDYNDSMGFLHYTPASVTCLDLHLKPNIFASNVNADITIADVRQNEPLLSLKSLTLSLYKNIRVDDFALAYNLSNLVDLNLNFCVNAIEFDCSVLPRFLQHLQISVTVPMRHGQVTTAASNVHFRNPPPHLVTMRFYGFSELIMHDALPSDLEEIHLDMGLIMDDSAGKISILSLPPKLKAFFTHFIKSGDVMLLFNEYIFYNLLNQPYDYAKAMLKHLPSRLPIYIKTAELIKWISRFHYLEELAMIRLTCSERILNVYQYFLETHHTDLDADKRQELERLSHRALQMLDDNKARQYVLLSRVPVELNAQKLVDVATLEQLATFNQIIFNVNEMFTTSHDNQQFEIKCSHPVTPLHVIHLCTRMKNLDFHVGNKAFVVNDLLALLPRTLQTLRLSFGMRIIDNAINFKMLNPDTHLKYVEITGLLIDIPIFAQWVEEIKSIKSLNQLVLSANVIVSSVGPAMTNCAHVNVHCHSVDIGALFSRIAE